MSLPGKLKFNFFIVILSFFDPKLLIFLFGVNVFLNLINSSYKRLVTGIEYLILLKQLTSLYKHGIILKNAAVNKPRDEIKKKFSEELILRINIKITKKHIAIYSNKA